MDRQHATPIHIGLDGRTSAVELRSGKDAQPSVLEADIQALVHAHPEALPIAEIDPTFAGAVAICRELQMGQAGRVDNFLITPLGLPVLVECKLWRNPQARREVVGQILDYAKTLSRWSFADVQREVGVRTGKGANALLDLIRAVQPALDERTFIDALTGNLRRGRFLLLILGDGIREDVEAIATYLQAHAGLHFTFGLVEFPIYHLPDGASLVAPRVLARTTSIVRHVVTVPEGYQVQEPSEVEEVETVADPEHAALGTAQQAFWKEFLGTYLRLDDQTQSIPKPARMGYLGFALPAGGASSWLTVYRDLDKGEVGVFLSAHRNSPGENAMNAVLADWPEVEPELGGTAGLVDDRYGRKRIIDRKAFGDLRDPKVRSAAFVWLAGRVNTFVNVIRPRIRDAARDDAARLA